MLAALWAAAHWHTALPRPVLLSLLTDPGSVRSYTVNAALTSLGVTAVFWMNDLSWRLFTELDAMRRSEAELAVMKERFRFAADLHDIQGHTLHVIKLKAAVAAQRPGSNGCRTGRDPAADRRDDRPGSGAGQLHLPAEFRIGTGQRRQPAGGRRDPCQHRTGPGCESRA